MEKSRLLFIDDEGINRINFEQAFLDEYEVLLADSGEAALKILNETEDIAVILSDQRMPGISGAEFFGRAAEVAPYAERIMITAYSEPGDMIDAINKGQVYRYILKPWNEDDLRITIIQAVERYRLKRNNRELLNEVRAKYIELGQLNAELEMRVWTRTNELTEANEKLAARIHQLETTRRELRSLQSLIPICSYCKKIRDDENAWHALEGYLQRNMDITFSHGICPSCYREVAEKELKEHMEK